MSMHIKARALLSGLLFSTVFTPPTVGFYWGWITYAAKANPEWPPWLAALAQAFMSWVIYWYMLTEQGLFATAQSSSFVVFFLLVAAMASIGAYACMRRETPAP